MLNIGSSQITAEYTSAEIGTCSFLVLALNVVSRPARSRRVTYRLNRMYLRKARSLFAPWSNLLFSDSVRYAHLQL